MERMAYRSPRAFGRNGVPRAATLCLSFLCLIATGCVTVDDYETIGVTTRANNLPECLTNLSIKLEGVQHAQPLVGLFVGITNYGESSKLWPTPAHAISAALFREPFYVSARTSEKRADLRLVTDLAIDRRTDVGRSAEDTLRHFDGVRDRLAPAVASEGARRGAVAWSAGPAFDEAAVFRGATTMTRARLLIELDSALASADAVALDQGRVVFVFYVSAHGRLGPDGRPYVLPSSALPDDPSTWIEQREIVARVGTFLSRSRVDGRSRKALLVFDVCRHFAQGADMKREARPTRGLPNAIVLESTSPQSYAWQWNMQTEKQSVTNVLRDDSWGFPFPPRKEQRGTMEAALASRISIAPLATTCAVSLFFADPAGASFDRVDAQATAMSAAHWARLSVDVLRNFASAVPEMQQKGEEQRLQFHAAVNLEWMPLLERRR